MGIASLIDEYDGEVSIIGTPAEEGGAGKVILLERGAFDETDYALMMHPSGGGFQPRWQRWTMPLESRILPTEKLPIRLHPQMASMPLALRSMCSTRLI